MRNLFLYLALAGACTSNNAEMMPDGGGSGSGDGSGSGHGSGSGSGSGSGTGSGSGSGDANVTALPATAIVFTQRDAQNHDTIYVRDLAGNGAATPILAVDDMVTAVALSPDRKQVAFTTKPVLAVVNVDGTNAHQVSAPITPPFGYDVDLDTPEWTPDGQTIYLSFGLFGFSNGQVTGGSALASVPASGGQVNYVQSAMGSGCQIVTGVKIAPDGSYGLTMHSVCTQSTNEGVWKHAADGTGTLLVHDTNMGLAKPMILGDGTILAIDSVGGANGLAVIKNGAIQTTLNPPTGSTMEEIATAPDGSALLVVMRDLNSGASNLYLTTDFQSYTPITSDGHDQQIAW